MKRISVLLFVVFCTLAGVGVILLTKNYYTPKNIEHDLYQEIKTTSMQKQTQTPAIQPNKPGASTIIPMRTHAFQTFNNCGPASLSMLLSYSDINISQQELGLRLRPYQNQIGDNDDKSVTLEEMAEEAKHYNLIPYHRPSGSLELLKLFIANDIPVVVRTWLHPGEDIGHYRLVRGYDDATGEIIQDDSFEGKDLRFPYQLFLSLWQPFNYEFLIAVPKEKDELARSILKEYGDEKTAWQHAYDTAHDEADKNPNDFYPVFNQSIALFYLKDYEKSIQLFESVQNRLPARMLWYQTEPAEAYLQTKQYDKLFQLTDQMLVNNRAFSEIYL
jgi:tetratricopeptide (TPR) repeat protein